LQGRMKRRNSLGKIASLGPNEPGSFYVAMATVTLSYKNTPGYGAVGDGGGGPCGRLGSRQRLGSGVTVPHFPREAGLAPGIFWAWGPRDAQRGRGTREQGCWGAGGPQEPRPRLRGFCAADGAGETEAGGSVMGTSAQWAQVTPRGHGWCVPRCRAVRWWNVQRPWGGDRAVVAVTGQALGSTLQSQKRRNKYNPVRQATGVNGGRQPFAN
jgi:hypothetical protein